MTQTLVTGASGFLGFQIARSLASRGESVYLVDRALPTTQDSDFWELVDTPNVEFRQLDLADPLAVSTLPEVQCVFHMAAENGTNNFYERPWQVIRNSTLPTLHLIERYRDASVEEFIYASSSEIYATTVALFDGDVPTPESIPVSFDDLANPRWSYGLSKAHGELATIHGMARETRRVLALRLHNVFGPRMGIGHFIPDFLYRARQGKYEVWGASQTRSYAYVADVVDQILLLRNIDATGVDVVNVGSAQERVNLDVARIMMDLIGADAIVTEQPAPLGSVDRRQPDLGKLFSLVGPLPETPLGDALKSTIDWYWENPWAFETLTDTA